MKKNMSRADASIRLVVAAVIIALWYFNLVSGVLLAVLGVVALIFIVTGFVNFCPLYAILKIRTRKSTS
jgi:uncharacterized membrane protein